MAKEKIDVALVQAQIDNLTAQTAWLQAQADNLNARTKREERGPGNTPA